MKYAIVLALFVFSLSAFAQAPQYFYVAAKTGLSIREKAELGSKVIDKIPYGTKISLLDFNEEKKSITTENMLGYWQKVKYNNKTGFIIDSYLFPWAPPKATVKTMLNYLAQSSLPLGAKLTVHSGNMNSIEEAGWTLKKQLYKNGAEWHQTLGYEYGSDVFFLPGFSLQQGFLLIRLIPEFKDIFTEQDEFPTSNKNFKRGDSDYKITVEKESFEEYNWYKKITVEFADGPSHIFEMFMIDTQLVVSYSSGV